jgi:hypothetical protein
MQYRDRDASRRLNLAMAIKNDIAVWTPQLRDRKIEQLASVIAPMNTFHHSHRARLDRLPYPRRLFGAS